MTKYILHGGELSKKSENNKKFFFEVAKSLPDNSIILGIYFARDENEIESLVFEDKKRFLQSQKDKNIKYVIADTNKSKLIEEIRVADAIYISGGNELYLKKQLDKIDFKNLIQGKIVSGSSAGTNILAKYYFTNDRNRIENGFGILPIKTFCHYTKKKIDKLKK